MTKKLQTSLKYWFCWKIIEKAAIVQVNKHMQANDLDDLFQSAYKNKHST